MLAKLHLLPNFCYPLRDITPCWYSQPFLSPFLAILTLQTARKSMHSGQLQRPPIDVETMLTPSLRKKVFRGRLLVFRMASLLPCLMLGSTDLPWFRFLNVFLASFSTSLHVILIFYLLNFGILVIRDCEFGWGDFENFLA